MDNKIIEQQYIEKLEKRNMELFLKDYNQMANDMNVINVNDVFNFMLFSIPMGYFMPQKVRDFWAILLSGITGLCLSKTAKNVYINIKMDWITHKDDSEFIENVEKIINLYQHNGLSYELIKSNNMDDNLWNRMEGILEQLSNDPNEVKDYYIYFLRLLQDVYITYHKEVGVK